MPLYDFQCKCGNVETDKLLSVEDMKQHVCAKCGEPLRPMPSNVSIQKGHSWYTPGYVDQAEIRITDEDGKKHVIDGRSRLGGKVGKNTTPGA